MQGTVKFRSPYKSQVTEVYRLNSNLQNIHTQFTNKIYGSSISSFKFDNDDFIITSRRNSINSKVVKNIPSFSIPNITKFSEAMPEFVENPINEKEQSRKYIEGLYEKVIEKIDTKNKDDDISVILKSMGAKPNFDNDFIEDKILADSMETNLKNEEFKIQPQHNISNNFLLSKPKEPVKNLFVNYQPQKAQKSRKFDSELERVSKISTDRNVKSRKKPNLTIASPKDFLNPISNNKSPHFYGVVNNTEELFNKFEYELENMRNFAKNSEVNESINKISTLYVFFL